MAKLYFRYSAMNAGKSTALLQVAHNYECDLGQGVLLFAPALDNRYSMGQITSRLGISHHAETLSQQAKMPDTIWQFVETRGVDSQKYLHGSGRSLGCILVDEAQFLVEHQVVGLHRFAHLESIPVICYGIRTDFRGGAFPGSAALLSIADELAELKTVCSRCKQRKATMNPRIDGCGHRILDGPQVGIEGPLFRYAPMCACCFYETAPVPDDSSPQ